MDMGWMLEEYDGIVYVSDLETYELRYLNKAGCALFDITPQEITQGNHLCYVLLQGLESPCPFCTNHLLNESSFYEWEHHNPLIGQTLLLKDRKILWEDRPSRIELAVDISEYRNEIAQKEKERDSVLKSLPGGITRVDARDGRTVLWYGADFLNMIGYTEEQFKHELHSQCSYVHPDDLEKVTEVMNQLKISKESVMMEIKIITRSGDTRILTTTFSYEDGEASEDGIPSFYSVGIDITAFKTVQERQRKALEDAYHAAKMANSSKTHFLSRMSHDIRTPMNAILGMTAIAAANVDDQAKVLNCLGKINTSGKHLLSLINEVLDMSKIESGHLHLSENNFNLAELVQNVLDMCRPLILKKNHKIKVNVDGIAHEEVSGDMDRLQQVFMNFLSNAIKYTLSGGNITFTIREKPLRVAQTGLFEFIFEDSGIGMTEEFVRHIFEPFSRAEDSRISKIQGTGLGMAISENIVHMMNGTIQVESVLEKGSRFTVTVPLKLRNQIEAKMSALENLPVLVADDDHDVCENTCLILNEIGMAGRWVLTGKEAVDEVVRAHKASEDYFAVILDWKMPEMDGLATTKAIRSKVGPDIPIIIVSAYDFSDVEKDFMNAGVDAFITKPLFKSKMLHVFRRFVHKNESEKNAAGTEGTPDKLSGKRLLVAEDNELNMEIAQEILQMAGIIVETAENGQEAIEKFSASARGYYDMILMDIQMPVRNGYAATREIRSLPRPDAREIPILAMTADAFAEDIEAAKRAGMNGHLAKPLDIALLYQEIGRLLQ